MFYFLENATFLEKWLCLSRNQVIEDFLFCIPKGNGCVLQEIKLLRNICLYSLRKWLCSLEESNYITQEMLVFPKQHGCFRWRNGINKLFQVVCGLILGASI
jgi:hypothetical protein